MMKLEGSMERLNGEHKYALVIAEHKAQDKPGRLHLVRAYSEDAWNVFTVAPRKTDLEVGDYICRVGEFRLDRNGYTNLLVYPMAFIGSRESREDITNSPVWEYIRPMMSPLSYGGAYQGKLNLEEVPEVTDAIEQILEYGSEAFSSLEAKLLKPSRARRFALAWANGVRDEEFRKEYPLLAAKYAVAEGDKSHELARKEDFIQKAFKALGEELKGNALESEVFSKLEQLLEQRKANKVAKSKAKVLAKKAAKKA